VEISRAIRLTSLATWVVVGGTVLAKYAAVRDLFDDYCVFVWAAGVATGILASALAWKQSDPAGAAGSGARTVRALLAIAAVSVLFVSRWWPSHFGGLPLVFVAWEAAQVTSPRAVAVWVAAQTVAYGLIMAPLPGNRILYPIPLSMWVPETFALAGLQAFAVLAAHWMRRERMSRDELARANRELLAARELAVAGSRAAERLRIARELHDALGHRLAALSLNLEAADLELRGSAAPVPKPFETAQALTRAALSELREVVTRVRCDDAADLATALTTMVAAIPSPAIHLALPEELPALDAERARAVLRCAQECITNAIRHAAADNLWIELEAGDDGVGLRVRDDGRGAETMREGHGLSGMRERLAALGGSLQLAPGPPGFEAYVRVP
jgi:signal transduction histidine kinase